jgi:hypothetical protein
MWELLNKGLSDREITTTVSREYGLNKNKVEKDYKDFIDTLKREKLVKESRTVFEDGKRAGSRSAAK